MTYILRIRNYGEKSISQLMMRGIETVLMFMMKKITNISIHTLEVIGFRYIDADINISKDT